MIPQLYEISHAISYLQYTVSQRIFLHGYHILVHFAEILHQ